MSTGHLLPYEHVTNPRTVAQGNFDTLEDRVYYARPYAGALVGPPLGGRLLPNGMVIAWELDELYTDAARDQWICTAAGIPGTWRPFVSAAAVDKNFVFDQPIPTDTWTITHNLQKRPSVTVVDSANRVVIGDIEYIDDNVLIVTFNGSFSGKAFLN